MKTDLSDADDPALRIAHLPKEAGWALITAGVVGLAVPGVPGTAVPARGCGCLGTRRFEASGALGPTFGEAATRPLSRRSGAPFPASLTRIEPKDWRPLDAQQPYLPGRDR